jgi:hypothetical protein
MSFFRSEIFSPCADAVFKETIIIQKVMIVLIHFRAHTNSLNKYIDDLELMLYRSDYPI